MKIVVVGGAGAMGQVIVQDLAESSAVKEVVIADFNQDKAQALKAKIGGDKITTAFADIQDKAKVVPALSRATAVINSTPYYYNLNVMEAALDAGCHYLDLGGLFHISRQQLKLHDKFKARKLLAVIGMGAAPGMTNVMAAHAATKLDEVHSIDIAIGCVDFTTTDHPFCPPYALDTIIDEYSMEAMVFENGEFRAVPPMSGEITINFPKPVGAANAIYTLHSEVATLPLSFKDKGVQRVTFRLGLPTEFHERLKFLMELGFGTKEPLALDEGKVSPRKVLAKLVERFPSHTGDPDDCEVVRVDVKGKKSGKETLVRVESTVYAHPKWKISCGALDTGVPPSIVAQMIGLEQIKDVGVLPPESCVPTEPFFAELEKRLITMQTTSEDCLVSSM